MAHKKRKRPQSGTSSNRNNHDTTEEKPINNSGNKTRSEKSKFPPYWDISEINSCAKTGQVILGQIRINPKKYTDAYTVHPKRDADVLLPGMRARNRSLNGDLVFVKIEPLSKWRVYEAFITVKFQEWISQHRCSGSGNSFYVTVGDFIQNDPEGFSMLFKDYAKLITKNLANFLDPPIPENFLNDLSWWQIIQRVGQVVGIHRQLNSCIGMGTLRPQYSKKPDASKQREEKEDSNELPPSNLVASSSQPAQWSHALFSPLDTRMPRIIIPKSSCPDDFCRQPDTFKLVRFVAKITDWPADSFFARGHLIRKFDNDHDFVTSETEKILVNAGFPYGLEECMRFPPDVETYVAEKLIPGISHEVLAEEIAQRRDFRSECVFTIDPRTARDLDDALHIKCLSPDEVRQEKLCGHVDVAYEVGVHIADVSYYVRPEDPVDIEALNRATSIYLVQLCVPMLPRQLCEELCSLQPGDDKLTFSVVFRVSKDGQIVSKWFGRSVINSCAKLSYEDAQAFIDEPERDWNISDLSNVKSGTDVKKICQCINMLNDLAVKMRNSRFEGGALQLNQVKPTFTLSQETGEPVGMAPFIIRPANRLVEEWMLAANEAVALVLAQYLPRTAFLRRHPPPTQKQLKEARTLLKYCDINVDVSSAYSIQDSLNRLAGTPQGIIWQHSDDLVDLCASMMGFSVNPGTSPSKCATASEEADLARNRVLHKEAHLLATLNVLTRCMNLAEYFCLGLPNGEGDGGGRRNNISYLRHYALNMNHYTHFTSPIRRYADLIVHRQLAQILSMKAQQQNQPNVALCYRKTSMSKLLYSPVDLATVADICNARKLESRKASEDSVELFFTVFVKECGPLIEACSVVNVLDKAFDVLILSSGLVRRVYIKDLDLKVSEYEKLEGSEKQGNIGVGIFYLEWNARPLNSAEIGGEEEVEASSTMLSTDPAIKESVVAPLCNCFRQVINLFDLVRCSVSVEGLNGVENCAGEEAPVIYDNAYLLDDDSKLNESNSIPESSHLKFQQNVEEANDQVPKLRVKLLRPTCEHCKDFAS